MKKVKIGVVGVGHLGRFHAKLYSEIPEVELIGIFDKDKKRAEEIASELKIKSFPSLERLLKEVEGVSIAAPTSLHYEITKKALENDCHIFVEKPVTSTVNEAEELVNMANEKNRIFQVGHIERFNGALMALEGIPINPLFIEAHRLAGFTPRGADVPVVLDLMIHDIDLILSLVKSPISDLSASGAAIISESEDIANCRISFENGCVANITSSRISAKKMRKMRIFQKNAYFSIDFNEGVTEVYHTSNLEIKDSQKDLAMSLGALDQSQIPTEILYSRLSRDDVNALKVECQFFAEAIINKSKPIVSGLDGLNALRVAGQIMIEIEKHKQLIDSQKP